MNSPSKEVQVISRLAARDIRTSIGSNLDALKRETGLDPRCFGTDRLKQELLNTYDQNLSVNVEDEWRLPYLDRLLTERTMAFYNGDTENHTKINELLQSLVVI